MESMQILKGGTVVSNGLTKNPFKGKTFQEIDKMFTEKGFKKVGSDPADGKGSYFHPISGRKYYLDRGGKYGNKIEHPHVNVHRMSNGKKVKR